MVNIHNDAFSLTMHQKRSAARFSHTFQESLICCQITCSQFAENCTTDNYKPSLWCKKAVKLNNLANVPMKVVHIAYSSEVIISVYGDGRLGG